MGNNNYKNTERNIPTQVFEAWRKLARPGEAPKIAKAIGKSTPTVYAAITKGYVYRPETIELINKYFADNPREPRDILGDSSEVIKMARKSKKKNNATATGDGSAVNP